MIWRVVSFSHDINSWIETAKELNDPIPEPGSSQASGCAVRAGISIHHPIQKIGAYVDELFRYY